MVKNLPATWGFYIGDETIPGDANKVNTLTDIIKINDPNHPILCVSYGSPIYSISYYISSFAETASVSGVDYYPVGASSSYGTISDSFTSANTVQSVDNSLNRATVMVIQSFKRAHYPPYNGSDCTPYPSCASVPKVLQM